MPSYELSDRARMQRAYLGTKVYMASHPEIRSLFRAGGRPSEFGDRVWDTTLSSMRFLDGQLFGRVIDLGCGWGILGIHVARVMGARVTCVDSDPRLAEVVRLHARLNDVEVKFKVSTFGDLRVADLTCDLLVGSEICYSEELARELAGVIARAAEAGVGQVLIADPGRPDFDDLCSFCSSRFKAEVSDLRVEGDDKPTQLLSVRF